MVQRQTLKSTAYHEAGHAVIARVLTLASGSATIVPNFDELAWGTAITHDPSACESAWEQRGHVRGENAAWHARIITSMAGAESERELLSLVPVGDDDDRYQIKLIMGEYCDVADYQKCEVRLRKMTRMLVRRHREKIERVARALLRRRTINGKALDKLVGRSVDDVSVNAPLLLAMYKERTMPILGLNSGDDAG